MASSRPRISHTKLPPADGTLSSLPAPVSVTILIISDGSVDDYQVLSSLNDYNQAWSQYPWALSVPQFTVGTVDGAVGVVGQFTFVSDYINDLITFTQMMVEWLKTTPKLWIHLGSDWGEVPAVLGDSESTRDLDEYYYWLHHGNVEVVNSETAVSVQMAEDAIAQGNTIEAKMVTHDIHSQFNHYCLDAIATITTTVSPTTANILRQFPYMANRAITAAAANNSNPQFKASSSSSSVMEVVEVLVPVNSLSFTDIIAQSVTQKANASDVASHMLDHGIQLIQVELPSPLSDHFPPSFQQQMLAQHRLPHTIEFDMERFFSILNRDEDNEDNPEVLDTQFASIMDHLAEHHDDLDNDDDWTDTSSAITQDNDNDNDNDVNEEVEELVDTLRRTEFSDFAQYCVNQESQQTPKQEESDYELDVNDTAIQRGLFIDYDLYDEHSPGFVGDKAEVSSDDDIYDDIDPYH